MSYVANRQTDKPANKPTNKQAMQAQPSCEGNNVLIKNGDDDYDSNICNDYDNIYNDDDN